MKENYIKSILIFLLILIVVSLFIVNVTSVRAEDNKTTDEPVFTERGGRRYWMMMSGDHNWYSILSKPVIKEL